MYNGNNAGVIVNCRNLLAIQNIILLLKTQIRHNSGNRF